MVITNPWLLIVGHAGRETAFFVWFLRISNLEKRLADLCGGRAAEQTLFFSHGNLLHLDRPPLIFNQCHFLSTPQSRLLSVQNEDILQQKSSRRNNHCRKWKRDFHILGRIQPNIGLANLKPIYHFKRTIFSSDRSSYTDDGPRYIRGTSFFRFSLSPLVQLMLQVSL